MRLSFAVAVVAVSATAVFGASASAAPVATTEAQYQAYGAVFPDPLAGCQGNCDPNSRGHTPATQFIQWQEFTEAITFMNKNEDWKRFMEIWPLDGKKGPGGGSKAGDEMWPGNNLSKLEWDPKDAYQSAGLARSDRNRDRSDLVVIRVTDENVPDADKKRYALSLSIHGIERAGAEGGIRAMEEIVTSVAEKRGDERILPKEVRQNAPTWREVLANSIIYFTLPNPDGWRRGSLADAGTGPGVFFQRYNGNGVDPNRDWPDVGYTFRPYSGGSEPETRAFQAFYRDAEAKGGQFAAGDDLHGMPFADALSYTLLPHGSHDLDKDYRIREASKLINRAQYEATKWSPYIIDNDEGPAHCEGTQLGDACDAIYAQTWGSVYDTINYTTTGSLGDWFDSDVGLGADGIDNEMAFSHLDRDIVFEPHGEQLHVAGNKAIIYAHLADMLRPPGAAYSVEGKSGYVPNFRLKRGQSAQQGDAPPGTSPQDDVGDKDPTGADPGPPPGSTYEFTVLRDADTYSGGMRVDVRASNVQGIGSGTATLKVQCKGCDEHPGVDPSEEWITVAEDYNQSFLYAQAGLTAAVNAPDPFTRTGEPVEWRALVSAPGGAPKFSIDFTSGPATSDGNTEGGPAPFLAAYDVANTDFFTELNRNSKADDDKFDAIDPAKVINGEQSLTGFKRIVLADNPLPGYTGLYKEEARPTGQPTPGFEFQHTTPTTPGQTSPDGCLGTPSAREEFPFEIKSSEANFLITIRIGWSLNTSDYDLYLFQDKNGDGNWDDADGDNTTVTPDDDPQYGPESAGFANTSEEIIAPRPPTGKYVIVVANCSAPSEADPWSGEVEFEPYPATGASTFTPEQKDAWMAKLREWVSAGGDLVLTDGALRALPELTPVPGSAINQSLVYVGQTSFQTCTKLKADDNTVCEERKDMLDHPLAKNVAQPAGRFGSDLRRQTFEPTPIGFAIQNSSGSDASFSSQYDVLQAAFTAAGGDPAGSSVTSSADNAAGDPARTALGQIPVGQGRVRMLGALLPQPTEAYDHPLGLEPYAVTYTGYILFCNLVDCTYEQKARPRLANPPAPPGPVKAGFDARLRTPLLASVKTRRGKRVPLRIRTTRVKRIRHLVVQYRKTGRGTKKVYKRFKPRLKRTTKRIFFKKGRIGQTYLFRIRAVGRNGLTSPWRHRRVVFPYDDQGKGRRYSGGWRLVKAKRAWRGGYSQSSRRGATLNFTTKGGGRVYLVARTGPNGGKALVGRGSKKRVVSFKSKKRRNRRVVTVINRTDKRAYRFRLKVLRGTVTVDGIGVRRR